MVFRQIIKKELLNNKHLIIKEDSIDSIDDIFDLTVPYQDVKDTKDIPIVTLTGHHNEDADSELIGKITHILNGYNVNSSNSKKHVMDDLLRELNWNKDKSKKIEYDKAIIEIENLLDKDNISISDKVHEFIKLKNLNINSDNESDGYSEIKDKFLSLNSRVQLQYINTINSVFINSLGIENPQIKKHFQIDLGRNKDLTLRLLIQREDSRLIDNKKWIINNGIIVPYTTFLIRGVFGLRANIKSFLSRNIGTWLFAVTGNKYIDAILSTEILSLVSNKNPVIYTYFTKNFKFDSQLKEFFKNLIFNNIYDTIEDKKVNESIKYEFKTYKSPIKDIIYEANNDGNNIFNRLSNGVTRYRLMSQIISIFKFKPVVNKVIMEKFKQASSSSLKLANNDVSEVTDLIIIGIMDYLSYTIKKYAQKTGDVKIQAIGAKLAVSLSDPTTYKVWDNTLRSKLVNYIEKQKQKFQKNIKK